MIITWFGHAAFRVEMNGAVVLIDPFLSGNPTYNGTVEEASAGCTHLVLTHGHADHIGDSVDIVKATGAQVVSTFEVASFLAGQGAENVNFANHGGTVDCGPFTASFTQAIHSSSMEVDGQVVYMGNPAGVVLKAAGEPVLYHMGDTDIFGDMALINEIHKPDIGIVPIGDRFTMGAKTAAMACTRFFDFKTVIPCHFGTFPIIDQTADAFVGEMGNAAGTVNVLERRVPWHAPGG